MSGAAVRRVDSIEVRRAAARGTAPAGSDPRVAFYRGEYDLAAALARKLSAPEARLLLARIALRLRRPQDAVEQLARWRSAGDRRKDAERAMLLASAFERLGDPDQAAALYGEPLPRGAGSALEHERIYLRAYGHWLRGEYDRAEHVIAEQRAGDELARGRSAELLGRIAVSRCDYEDAARRFEAALAAFDAMPAPDEGARVAALAGIATVAVETLAFDLYGRLAAGYERSLRTQGTKPRLFRIGRSLVLLDGLQGDDEAAFRTATALQNQAEQTSERVLAHVTLAEFLRVRGDRTGPKLHLELAAQALRAERGRAGGTDLTAALMYVVEASYSDPHAAAEVLARVLPPAGRIDPAAGAEHGSRAAALVLYARGRSAIALGDAGAGAELVHAARAIWHEHGYYYRVAVVDLDLAEVFGDRGALENARQVIAELPPSWLLRRADRIETRLASGLDNLSPAERRVLRELCAGKSNREIAVALERSESTIRNQTQRIFDVLGVNSRAALVARCIDLGL